MIYLDNNATTMVDPKVYVKQCEVLRKNFGNASSVYPIGVEAKQIIKEARQKVANLINADIRAGDRVIFTSCATESNNAVFHSVLDQKAKGKHIIISEVEHPAVIKPAAYYEGAGCRVERIRVDKDGFLDEEQIINSINENTVLVSIMMVNSETGVIYNIEHIVKIIRKKNPKILIHTDAVQAAGKIKIDVQCRGVDFLSLSGHKFHAPKGIGVLYIRRGCLFNPFFLGGHQEEDFRAGTENVASIAAIGEAAYLAQQDLENGVIAKVEALRNEMEEKLKQAFPDSIIFGENNLRVGNTTNIGFKEVNGSKLVLQLAQKGVCISSGTACNSLTAEPSKVLRAMNVSEDYIRSIRISLSKENTDTDIQTLINEIKYAMIRRK